MAEIKNVLEFEKAQQIIILRLLKAREGCRDYDEWSAHQPVEKWMGAIFGMDDLLVNPNKHLSDAQLNIIEYIFRTIWDRYNWNKREV